MDENNNGFESTENKENTAGENSQNSNGYTVTPDGGFYSHSKENIIQDDISRPDSGSGYQNYSQSSGQNNNYQQNTNYQQNSGYQNNNYQNGQNPDPASAYRDQFRQPYEQQYAQQKPKKPKRPKKPRDNKSFNWKTVVAAALVAAIVGAGSAIGSVAIYNGVRKSNEPDHYKSSSPENVNITVDKTSASMVEAVAEKAGDSVVGIRTTTSVNDFFFGNSDSVGSGSGVVYSEDGYIVTNYHVIEQVVRSNSGGKIEVFIGDSDATSYQAEVIGYSISTDLAVIKINVKGLHPIELGNSDNLKVGQFVVAMGSPGGLDFRGSVTYGIISGLNRMVSKDSEVRLIQTDAAINPGNSGGALLDVHGRLIGINSSKIVSQGFEGMGFSIPVNTVKEKVDKIISRQNSEEPYIGINISQRYTKEVLEYYNYPNGAVVSSVNEDSPAEKAGIKRADIITEFNGKAVKSPEYMEELLLDCKPGQKVKVKLYRSGHYYSTDITIGANN